MAPQTFAARASADTPGGGQKTVREATTPPVRPPRAPIFRADPLVSAGFRWLPLVSVALLALLACFARLLCFGCLLCFDCLFALLALLASLCLLCLLALLCFDCLLALLACFALIACLLCLRCSLCLLAVCLLCGHPQNPFQESCFRGAQKPEKIGLPASYGLIQKKRHSDVFGGIVGGAPRGTQNCGFC